MATDKKKQKISKIAAAKARAKDKASADKVIDSTPNYEKRSDGKWYNKKNGELVTKAGTITLLENRHGLYKKGQSGNPKGYPKGRRNRSTVLRELLELTLKDKRGKNMPNPLDPSEKAITVEKAIMTALVKKALGGDVNAIREVQDTLFGKIKDKVEISDAPTVIRDDIPDDS